MTAVTGEHIAELATANIGKKATSTNSLGGRGFESSATGDNGRPEYWCADFAKWVWQHAGVEELAGLNAAAHSFYTYGGKHSTFSHTPRLGAVAIFSGRKGDTSSIEHVAIVSKVNHNGTIETISGDWGGHGSSESAFAGSAHAAHNTPAYHSAVDTHPNIMGYWILGYTAPAGLNDPVSPPTHQPHPEHKPKHNPGPEHKLEEFTTWGSNVRVHSKPSVDSKVVHTFTGPTPIHVAYQVHAEKAVADGFTNDAWAFMPDLHGYMSNIYIDVADAWLPGVPEGDHTSHTSHSHTHEKQGRISVSQVTYNGTGSWKHGPHACQDYIDHAMDKLGITDSHARAAWTRGMLTIAERESSYNAPGSQVNIHDSNAHGALVADGHPANCSRGGWQVIPETFAAHHQPGTSTDIYEPVANCSASMNYIMSRYGVSRDGSNLAAKVQQADPHRPPRGY